MDLMRQNDGPHEALLDSELDARVKQCNDCLNQLAKDIKQLDTWKKKINTATADEKLHRQIPEKFAHIKSLLEQSVEAFNGLKEVVVTGEKSRTKEQYVKLLSVKMTDTNGKCEKVSHDLLAAMKANPPRPKKAQRRVSGDVVVQELEEVEVEKEKMAQYNDATNFGQIVSDRQQDLNQIEALMDNIHGIAIQIAEVVQRQDEKFAQIGVNTRITRVNAKAAVKELNEADAARGSANTKMLFLLFCIIVVILFIVVLLSI